MTGLIAIDEAGDLGSAGTRFFSMAAIIMFRSRDFKKAASSIPDDNTEHKWNNSTPERRAKVLRSMCDHRFRVAYVVVDKKQSKGHVPVYGNELYRMVLRQVISDAMECLPCKGVDVFLDRCSFLTSDNYRRIVYDEAERHDINPMRVNMISSSDSRCIQLADFVAGACRSKSEYGDDSLDILGEKVLYARSY